MEKSSKKISLIIIAFGILIGLINYNIEKLSNLNNQLYLYITKPTSIELPQKVEKNIPRYAPTIIKQVGDKFTLGSMEYEVLSAEDRGSTYGYQETAGKFIVLKIKVTNVGKVENGLSKIYVQDSEGRRYDQSEFAFDVKDSDFGSYGITRDYNGIRPGFSETFVAPFEVPLDSSDLELEFPSVQGPIVLSVQLGI